MSPNAYALALANQTAARGLPADRQAPMQALRSYLSAKLLDTTPPEGTPIEVRFCKAGTPGEVGEVWCPGAFCGTVGQGADLLYLVTCTTPRRAQAINLQVAPGSVRFIAVASDRARLSQHTQHQQVAA